jgi:hypothetical protein
MKYQDEFIISEDKGIYTFDFKNYSIIDRIKVCLLVLIYKKYVIDSNEYRFVQYIPKRGKPKKSK